MLVSLTKDTEEHPVAGRFDHAASGEADPDGSGGARKRSLRTGRRRARIEFLLASLAALIVVGAIGTLALRHVATQQAIGDARAMTAAFASGVIAPELTAGVLRGDPAALARLDGVVRRRVLHDPVVRVKVWERDGRIAYSDVEQLIGTRVDGAETVQAAFAAPEGESRVTDLSRPENRFERFPGKLVEVYWPVRAASGEMVVVETYQRAETVDAAGRRLLGAFLPVLLLGLLALGATQLPLAIFHTRRVRQHERERERLVRRADDKVEEERLRIAAELHDGVVQDLVGVAYELRAVADELPEDPHAKADGDLRTVLHRSEQSCRTAVRALRSLLLELRPGERRAESIEAALERLAEPLSDRGVTVRISVDLVRDLPVDVAEIVHRAAQEALRNVERHAGARTAEVTLTDDGSVACLCVHDDGRGMTAADLEEQRAAGHMGLRLLADGVAARGGSLEIESEPGTGTRLMLWLPWG
ncbi:MAG TPA: histidine kinase [Solirubrobacteraceae bacterium]|nr:histidine kinase [Solirubrobacteraceae bacterium]